jgi:Right handed beta helix region
VSPCPPAPAKSARAGFWSFLPASLAAACILTALSGTAANAAAVSPGAVTPLADSHGACVSSYYVSPSGNDSNSGVSSSKPWKTLARVNSASLPPGTCVLLQGGATFSGELYLNPADAGSAEQPVTVTSYGNGRATISAGAGTGVYVYDTAGVDFEDINVVGNGYSTNTGSGFNFYNDVPGAVRYSGITITDASVSGFGQSGILIGGEGSDGSESGFAQVTVESVTTDANGDAGLQLYGAGNSDAATYANADVLVDDVTSYGNVGIANKGNNSGNGIVLGDVDNATIEDSTAYDNGADNNYPNGGPVGIWAYDGTDVTIEHCTSYDNKSATSDGDGFDLDGGISDSVMEYNYSYDNNGAGFLVFEYDGARPLTDAVVRYNISKDDARVGSDGGIAIGSDGTPVNGVDVYSNTVFTTPSPGATPAGIRVWTGALDVLVADNIIETTGGVPLVSVESGASARFLGNDYFPDGSPFLVYVGGSDYSDSAATAYQSLAAWQQATGVETLGGVTVGQTVNPKFAGNPLSPAVTPSTFLLQSGSPLYQTGVSLASLGIDGGGLDYFGKSVPSDGPNSVGAAQS